MSQLSDITSANAKAVLTVERLFPAGIELFQFSTDQSVSMDEITIAETRKGVDGHMVAGFVPSIFPVTVMLEPSSPSTTALSAVFAASKQQKTIFRVNLTVTVPSIQRVFTWSNGVLKSGTLFPAAKKVLDPTTWKFDFADFNATSL